LAKIDCDKRILGQLHGQAIRLWPRTECSEHIVGEILENTLSVVTSVPDFDLASILTASHLGLFILPPARRAFGKDAMRRSLLEVMKEQGLEIGDR